MEREIHSLGLKKKKKKKEEERGRGKRRRRKKKLLNTAISVPSMLMQMVHKFVKLHGKSMRRGRRTSSSVRWRKRGKF